MYIFFAVAGEPTSLNATSHSNNIIVTWKSPNTGDNVTGYMIYYQPEGGEICSNMVYERETETYLLDGLLRGVTYNISIVALLLHLPSLLVGSIAVMTGLVFCNLTSYTHYRMGGWRDQ